MAGLEENITGFPSRTDGHTDLTVFDEMNSESGKNQEALVVLREEEESRAGGRLGQTRERSNARRVTQSLPSRTAFPNKIWG